MGGSLAIIETQEEFNFVGQLAKKRILWLGASNAKKRGKWQWLDGTDVKFPVRGRNRGQRYLIMNIHGSFNGRRDAGFDGNSTIKNIQGFICEWKQ